MDAVFNLRLLDFRAPLGARKALVMGAKFQIDLDDILYFEIS